MSERGWIDFLHAEGVDDWVVLHGGATAPGGCGALLTIAADRLTVRLTRGVFQLEPTHVELARAVSAVARSMGVAADRGAAQEVQLAIAAKPDDVDVGFWRAPGRAPRRDRGRVARPRLTTFYPLTAPAQRPASL